VLVHALRVQTTCFQRRNYRRLAHAVQFRITNLHDDESLAHVTSLFAMHQNWHNTRIICIFATNILRTINKKAGRPQYLENPNAD